MPPAFCVEFWLLAEWTFRICFVTGSSLGICSVREIPKASRWSLPKGWTRMTLLVLTTAWSFCPGLSAQTGLSPEPCLQQPHFLPSLINHLLSAF